MRVVELRLEAFLTGFDGALLSYTEQSLNVARHMFHDYHKVTNF